MQLRFMFTLLADDLVPSVVRTRILSGILLRHPRSSAPDASLRCWIFPPHPPVPAIAASAFNLSAVARPERTCSL
jgi:hypothetical protein